MTTRKLNPSKLQSAFLKLDLTNLPDRHKRTLKQFALVQVNPDSQKPDVVARKLKRKRRKQVEGALKPIARALRTPQARGRDALEAMDDSEWEGLIGS